MENNKLAALKDQIKQALEHLTDGTPIVRKIIATPEGYAGIEEKIIIQVMAGASIAEAIVSLDDEFDINHID